MILYEGTQAVFKGMQTVLVYLPDHDINIKNMDVFVTCDNNKTVACKTKFDTIKNKNIKTLNIQLSITLNKPAEEYFVLNYVVVITEPSEARHQKDLTNRLRVKRLSRFKDI